MRIADVYRPGLYACQLDETLAEAADRMHRFQVGALAVLDGTHVMGMLTERDIIGAIALRSDPKRTPVCDFASFDPQTAHVDDDSTDVARWMVERGVRHLPVVGAAGRILGMLSMRDLLALEVYASALDGERRPEAARAPARQCATEEPEPVLVTG
jgi:CBS domain-containing protein